MPIWIIIGTIVQILICAIIRIECCELIGGRSYGNAIAIAGLHGEDGIDRIDVGIATIDAPGSGRASLHLFGHRLFSGLSDPEGMDVAREDTRLIDPSVSAPWIGSVFTLVRF